MQPQLLFGRIIGIINEPEPQPRRAIEGRYDYLGGSWTSPRGRARELPLDPDAKKALGHGQ